MKKSLYFILAFLPVAGLAYAAYSFSAVTFVWLLAAYVIYRGIIDGLYLLDRGIISRREARKIFIPFWTRRFYKYIYSR